MKKLFALWAFVLLAASAAWAQPTIFFSSGSPCTGETFCVDVTVKDFTDIASMKFPVRWDPKVIEFTGVQGLNLARLTAANFDDSRKAEGLLLLNWVGDVCEKPNPDDVTLQDGVRIFQLCFRALGGYGTTSQIEITDSQDLIDDPEPIVVKRPPSCFNIGLLQRRGFISTCVRPLNLQANAIRGNTGDLVCFDVSVTGFDGLTSLQFTMDYDPTILRFSNVINTEKLRNLGRESFGTPDRPNIGPGKITMSWSWTDIQIPSITVPDSTVIFQVCFDIIGPCESVTELKFSSSLTPLEAINVVRDTQYAIPAILTPGILRVGTCTPTGLQVIADCGPEVNLNDEVCVKVSVRGMNDLSQFAYLMNFNPNILRYKDVRILATNSQIPGFNKNTHFNINNVGNGVLGVSWTPAVPTFSATAPDNTVIYEVCFDVVGLGGNAPISFDPTTALVRRRGNNANIRIAPTNCAVRVRQPEGVLMTITGGQGAPGDTVCLDLSVSNFNRVVELDFSLAWEPTHLQFISVRNVGFPNATLDSFNLDGAASGLLSFEWSSSTPRSLTDGATLFNVCYIVRGTPPGELGVTENCDGVQMVDIPIVPKVVTAASNGRDIGLNFVPAEVCILNPTGFFLIIGKETAFRGDTTCVDFRVAGFEGITSAEFTVNWKPADLAFARVNLSGALGLQLGANINTTDANVGVIRFSWLNASGATLTDSTSLFEVCYVPIGPAPQCVPIEVNTTPTPSVTTLQGPGSVYPLNGELCIEDRLIITEKIITRVTCPDASDGTVSLKVSGGKGNIFFFWESAPRQFTGRAINLPVGKVPVTIFDESRPPLVLRDTFEIFLTDTLPQVNAGPDRVLGCNPPFTLLSGSGSTGAQFAYSWSTVTGSLPGDTQRPNVIAGAPGQYVLTVFNRNTSCAVRDTVVVFPPNTPEASAGRDQLFSCLSDTLELSAALSSQGDTIAYRWTALDGGIILPGDEAKLRPKVLAAGIYALEVRNTVNGCIARDTVLVENATEIPDAKAGADQELGCTGDPVTLDASTSVNLRPVIYAWFDTLGNQISTGVQTQVSTLGTFILRVTEEGSGCVARDTVRILPSSAFPLIDAGRDTAINCAEAAPLLSPSISNTTNFQIQWTARDGGQLEAGSDTMRMPKVIAPGRFLLQVRDLASNCVSVDSVLVREDRVLPTVNAGPDGDISCRTPSIVLTASASSTNGPVQTSWQLNGQTLNRDSLSVRASQGGTYVFTALDPGNGCSAVDSAQVTSAIENPDVIALVEDPKINCNSNELDLNVLVTPQGASYQTSWSSANGGAVLAGGNTFNARVRGAARYVVEVTNTASGCVGQTEIIVAADTLAPAANAGRDTSLTCTQTTLALSGAGSATGANISYAWASLGTAPSPTPADAQNTTVSGAGIYVLTVRNEGNGCFARDSVRISLDTLAPMVVIAPALPITCNVSQVTISAAGSSSGAQFTATWTGLSGQPVSPGSNPLEIRANQPGDYQLRIVNNSNGCESGANVTVPEDRDKPAVQVVRDVILPCQGAVVTLSGQGSASGANFTYLWRTLSGTGTITDERTLSPKINTPGRYSLQVTNTLNGCLDTAIVMAIIDPALVLAQAGADQITCTDDAQIAANLPAGTTGVWSSKTGASIESPTQLVTEVFSLRQGANIFVWTLSKAECPNYSADSLIVTREVAPRANNDQLTLESGQRRATINVLQNDQVPVAGAVISVTRSPNIGRIDSIAGGVVTYAVAPRIFGMDEFTYQVCNQACPTLCDSAIVKVDVKFDPNAAQDPVANTITPNGDGANDELRFEVLEDVDPNFFPDNELIIFNRWGDIVFRAKPYSNDWRGVNAAGKDLPQATYYYILRLDISKGLIIKGDVTIVK